MAEATVAVSPLRRRKSAPKTRGNDSVRRLLHAPGIARLLDMAAPGG